MKKAIAFFLLLIFTFQSTQSLWIITSFQINRDYIASNLCINRFDKVPVCKGQCFLDKELGKEQKQSKKNPSAIDKELIFVAPQSTTVQPKVCGKNIPTHIAVYYEAVPYTSFLTVAENPPELA